MLLVSVLLFITFNLAGGDLGVAGSGLAPLGAFGLGVRLPSTMTGAGAGDDTGDSKRRIIFASLYTKR